MVSLQSLYTQAEKQNIPILFYPMPGCGSMSVQLPGGSCAIGMDVAPQAEAVEREHLGHELGHCMTGSFYNIYAVADLRERQENRADKWAIRRLIPVEALDDAIAAGHTELWDLAEFFGVTECACTSMATSPPASISTSNPRPRTARSALGSLSEGAAERTRS